MRKKFTMLFAVLLACVGVVKAQYYVIESIGENITDLNALTEDSYVALYNVGKSKYIYEGGDHKLYMGTAADAGAGHEYIWQVHKEGEKFLFTSASGRYFSTPLDGKDVYAVKSDNAAKDKFTITAHQEDGTKWLVQSTNNSKYWDAQNERFVGWAGSGANSRYEIRPVTVSAAVENDFTKLITTNEDDIKWYTIKNVRKQKYATYAGDAATMTQQETVASAASFFYFTGRATAESATVGIHNLLAGDKLCTDYNFWTATGREWLIKKQSTGLSIAHTNNANRAWNDASGGGQKIEYWGDSDPGSAWLIEIVTDFTEHLTAAKAAAILEIEKLSGISAIYDNVANQFKTEIEGVTENSAEGLLAVNNILENYRKSIDGKSMKFRVDGRGSRFLGYSKTNNRIETQVFGFDDAYWTLKYVGNGYFKLYNPVHKVWLGAPDGAKKEDDSKYTPGLANEAEASLYKFEVTNGGTTVLLVASNGNIAHAAGDNHIMHYSSTGDQASWWAITDAGTFSMTYDEYKEFLAEKSTMMNKLTGYAKQLQDNYGLVKSGDKIAVVVNHPEGGDSQPSSNLLDGNNGTYVHSAYSGEDNTTHHYIEVELSEAARNIFCYFSKRNNNNRPSVIKVLAGNSADALNEVATLNMAESADNNVQSYFSEAIDLGAAYTHLRFVVTKTNTGSKFFTLSEFYVLPINTTTEGIAALAGASIVDADLEARLTAAENSLKTLQLPETLAEVKAALDNNVNNHVAENPALGQYTTISYNELKVAYEACTTIDKLEAVFEAFEKFQKAKNLPVFTIGNGNVKDYAKDKSIYDDNDETLNFKATNVYDKTMWWALDMTETAVKVTEEVGIYNVGTGNGFWGASSIKVTETNENDGAGIADDNIFLFYTTGNSTPVHFQADYSEIVRWGSYDAKSGSAAMFTYIGNTYDLNQLTDEYFAAANELAAIKVPAFNFAAGVNNYDVAAKPVLDAAIANRTTVLGKLSTAEEIASAKTLLEAAVAGVQINMPENGKFYRVRCAGDGMKYLQSTLDSSNESDIRMQVLSDATSVNATFCYIDGALVSYATGLYINAYRFNGVGTKSDVVFSEASNGKVGTYNIKVGGRYIFGTQENNMIDSGTNTDSRDGYTWCLEEVTTLPVTVSAAGYATLYAPIALNIPDDVTVYTATVDGEYLTLNEVEGTIPANTGVMIEAAADTYDFTVASDVAAVENNAFTGSYAKSVKNANAKVYTLQKPAEKEVGFYLFKGQDANGNATYINGFRAWVELSADASAQALRIRKGAEEGTTGIEQLVNPDGELVIYDLAGRRVEKMEKGIYIVNGKKVIR